MVPQGVSDKGSVESDAPRRGAECMSHTVSGMNLCRRRLVVRLVAQAIDQGLLSRCATKGPGRWQRLAVGYLAERTQNPLALQRVTPCVTSPATNRNL